jgi:hypothetical protein
MIAQAFGWSVDDLREREVVIGETVLDVGRGYLGIQPAALFATLQHRNGFGPVDAAALYGYHAAVRWGLVTDGDGITAFNSHWLVQDRWFRLPTIAWDEIERSGELLAAFQPDAIAAGEPERIALEAYPTPTLLQPVDDELVERLDAWRDEALKGSRSASGVDEQLQILFAKLFVLRTIEDKRLAPSVTPLCAAIDRLGRINTEALAQTFTEAKAYIGSELFDDVHLDSIPEHVIFGIINDLYVPRRLPGETVRYNFAWIDADVLGLAYEKYLSTILHPLPPLPQFDLFTSNYRDVARISVRKAGGVYYTPEYLTKYLATKCIDDFLDASEEDEIPKIVDFACGSGSFLVAGLDTLLNRLKRRDPSKNWGKFLIDGGYISGIDVDDKAVTVARLNLWNRLTEEPDPLPLPDLSKVVVAGDGLNVDTWGPLARNYDIALGNPPFLATAHVSNREELESRFETATGRYDYSYLFVEQAIKVTNPKGLLGMVVPNRLFRNHNAASIRGYLTSRMDLSNVVDFGSNEVFQGTSAYIGCLVAVHQQPPKPPATTVRVLEVKTLPDQFVASMLLEAEASADEAKHSIRSYRAQHPRGSTPWILLSADEKRQQIALADVSVRLDTVAGIYQGIRTGANDIFILHIEGDDERYGVQVLNALGDSAVLERGLLHPVVFGSEVQRYKLVNYDKYLLYPYLDGRLVAEPELENRFPQTYKYLQSYRDILSSRTSIGTSGQRWYELVRRRGEDWLKSPKLLIRDLAPETAFAADPEGGVFIVGGTAVIPQDDAMLFSLLGYLNSHVISSLVRRSTPQFKGNFQKFEPQHLQGVPILNRLFEDDSFGEELGELSRRILLAPEGPEKADLIEAVDHLVLGALSMAGLAGEA